MKTFSATPSDIEQQWYIVDAEGMVLGRLATEVARIIRGKHKPIFTPHMDTGDNVIVINASKVKVTGRKAEQKEYFRHTGYMGHERFTPFATHARQAPGAHHREGRLRHAAEDRARPSGPPPQASRVRERRASARRAAAQDVDLQQGARSKPWLTQNIHTIGRRKEAVCRVFLKPGSGKWDVNGRTLGDYFPRPSLVSAIQQPFVATDMLGRST